MKQLTDEELEAYDKATKCYLCNKPLDSNKVMDHHHFTGKCRGPAHRGCNLQLKYRAKSSTLSVVKKQWEDNDYKVPVTFQNLRGYDGHLIMKGFQNSFFLINKLSEYQITWKDIYHLPLDICD